MRFRLASLLPFLLVVLTGGCDASFDAFEESDYIFSVFGYLDANADRQYVRIEPLRDSSFVGSGSFDARVTLENMETGETILWEDRVFHTVPNRVKVHNFTTTTDIESEATYRFQVVRERDGATSSAIVTLPPAFPKPDIVDPPDRRGTEGAATVTQIIVRGVEKLGGVRAEYDYKSCNPTPREEELRCVREQTVAYHLADTVRQSNGTIRISIPWSQDIKEEATGEILLELYSFKVTVASAGADWPTYAEDNPPGDGPQGQPLPPPGIGTNIENGVGFLGGTYTHTLDVPILQ